MTKERDAFASGGLFGLARRIHRNSARRFAERAAVATLSSMDDHMLRDIGVQRADVARLVREGRD
jgi:uncharacterized protein YjiS (DUF1127 family)